MEKNFVMGFAMIMVLVVFLVGCRDSKAVEAEVLALNISLYLQGKVLPSGHYDRSASELETWTDPWGTSFVVEYSNEGAVEVMIVRSYGPDRRKWTADDIFVKRNNLVPFEAGKSVGKMVRGVVEGAAGDQ